MKPLIGCALLVLLSSPAFAQVKPEKPKRKIEASPAFLVEALSHRAPSIRLRAAQMLADESVDAAPALVDSVLTSSQHAAVRAGVVLVDRLDKLRRTTVAGQTQLKLTERERQLVRRLLSVVQDERAESWRFYLATNLLAMLDPDSLPEVLPALAAALRSGDCMKQYATVQAMYRLGPAARDAEEALWSVLDCPGRFRGLFIAKRVLDDDLPAWSDEVGVYDITFRLESYVLRDALVLETLRRVGAPPARLTAALACLASHESQDVRLEVARQLGLLDAPAQRVAAKVLACLLAEPDSVLVALLSDADLQIRDDAIALFTRLGPAAVETVPALARLLSARDDRLRVSAALTLGRIGPGAAAAVPALRRALQFERLREGADYEAIAEALEKISGGK
jgi:HEAT repeat protein